MNDLIVIEKLPVIVEQLQAVKQQWDAIADQAKTMVATEDTIQAVKTMRAEMRKDFEAYEKQRIAAKKQYLAPWDAIEAAYKECVKDSFTAADTSLKDTIQEFEIGLMTDCETELREYFNELCCLYSIDFVEFETAMNLAGLKITLADAKSTNKKRLRDGLKSAMGNVSAAVDSIIEMEDEDEAEILVEYEKCFDVGQAVAIVKGRKRRVAAEREAAEARKTTKERVEAHMAEIPAVTVPSVTEAEKPDQEELYDVSFTCYGITKAQAAKIKNFLKGEGINYR